MILDVDKAADFLGVSTETIRILARSKKIPAAKVGRLWRFTEEDLINFVRNQYEQANGQPPSSAQASVPPSVAA